MIRGGKTIAGARVLVLGITFKENCPDIRNSRVVDLVRELADYGCTVDVYDPHADPDEVRGEYGVELVAGLDEASGGPYDAAVIAVAHNEFRTMDVRALVGGSERAGIVYDLKGILDRSVVDGRL